MLREAQVQPGMRVRVKKRPYQIIDGGRTYHPLPFIARIARAEMMFDSKRQGVYVFPEPGQRGAPGGGGNVFAAWEELYDLDDVIVRNLTPRGQNVARLQGGTLSTVEVPTVGSFAIFKSARPTCRVGKHESKDGTLLFVNLETGSVQWMCEKHTKERGIPIPAKFAVIPKGGNGEKKPETAAAAKIADRPIHPVPKPVSKKKIVKRKT